MSRKNRTKRLQSASKSFVGDGFVNAAAKLGQRQGLNLLSDSSYEITNNISWDRETLDAAYTQNWVVRKSVDAYAKDMTREGVEILSTLSPETQQKLERRFALYHIWGNIRSAIKWGRLYGGGACVILIEGEDMKTPLNIQALRPGSFKGLKVLDRWTLWPTVNCPVHALGGNIGMPKYYRIGIGDTTAIDNKIVHYSRVIRFEGPELPYWKKMQSLWWGQSIVESLYDRLMAFDNTMFSYVQLAFKAQLRTVKVKGLRELLAAGGSSLELVQNYFSLVQFFQSTEGLTVLDSEDEFQTFNPTFTGLSELVTLAGEQISGATGIPLTRLFGQSPAGLNSTGESDIRSYYDEIAGEQASQLSEPIEKLYKVIAKSGEIDLPSDFTFTFRPLWKMNDTERADIAVKDVQSISEAFTAGLIDREIALRELRQQSRVSGRFSNLTDDYIEEAAQEPPSLPDGALFEQVGETNAT